jgi:hypothetical protein
MKTAVEWLFERLERMIPRTKLYDIDKKQYLEQAKAMEKEQIIDAWNDGYEKGLRVREEKIINPVFDAETYYDDTYGK